jgi:hypothetical protein
VAGAPAPVAHAAVCGACCHGDGGKEKAAAMARPSSVRARCGGGGMPGLAALASAQQRLKPSPASGWSRL